MKIESKEIMVLKVDKKEKQDHTYYVAIGIASVDDGTTFTVNSTNLDYLNIRPFSKHLATFNLQDSKYGMKLVLEELEELE